MHGRPRKRGGGDGGASEQKEKAKIAFLEPLQAQVLQNHHNCCYTKEALQKNARLLELNPEVNTAWNYRKLALRHLIASEQDVEVHKALAREELRVPVWTLILYYGRQDQWTQFLSKNEKFNGTNYQIWKIKVKLLWSLQTCGM
ncbi:hypothetical protein O6H91_Y370700 [Diphasiastrum complanatum]|nr:hypothetical protein O6H91_Y370700 [Diphasiastrum complanatum]